jgi:hypothetical protein
MLIHQINESRAVIAYFRVNRDLIYFYVPLNDELRSYFGQSSV